MAQLYYEARKRNGLYRGVVYHYSNIKEDGGEVLDYQSKECKSLWEALDAASQYLDDEGLEAEMMGGEI